MNSLAQEIPSLEKSPEDVYVIHACFAQTNNASHFSHRIVCLYIQNLNGSFSEKFSLEKYASKGNISIEDIEDWYDDLEIYLLDDFNSFLKTNVGSIFIYWLNEGQELILDIIKTRFEELNYENANKVFQIVPASNRKNIQYLLKSSTKDDIPGDLKLFIKKYNNEQLISGYLNAGEESHCFGKKEFVKIGTSVISKVTFFIKLINKHSEQPISNSTIKTFAPIDFQSMKVVDILKNLNLKSWLFLIGLVTLGISMGGGFAHFVNENDLKSLEKQNHNLEKAVTEKQYETEKNRTIFSDSISALNQKIILLSDSLGQARGSLKKGDLAR